MSFQISATLMDACVLAILDKTDVYGYELTQRMKNIMNISESTLYPVLRRLQRDGMVTTYDRPFNGRNRRYYSITPEGRTQCQKYRIEWEEYKNSVDSIMHGGEKG